MARLASHKRKSSTPTIGTSPPAQRASVVIVYDGPVYARAREHGRGPQLEALEVMLIRAAQQAGELGAHLSQRKLALVVDVLTALTSAVFYDPDPRALEGVYQWARKYHKRPSAHRVGPRGTTLQEWAREMRERLAGWVAAAEPNRGDVAGWLAREVSMATRVEHGPRLERAIYSKMPMGDHGGHVDGSGRVHRSDPFVADAKATIVAAFKAAGVPADIADQLFKRETQKRARAVRATQKKARAARSR